MGQYRLSMYLNKQIGLMLVYSGYSIDIMIPFISVHIATTKHAKGYDIFTIILNYFVFFLVFTCVIHICYLYL